MNRELRHEERKAYIREVNLNAREEGINTECCLHVTGGSILTLQEYHLVP